MTNLNQDINQEFASDFLKLEHTIYCPIPNQWIDIVKENVAECGIEILGRERLTKELVVFKMTMSSPFKLFMLGGLCQICLTPLPESLQKVIDNLYKDNLQ